MDPLVGTVVLGVLFVGTHVGLAAAPVRSRLVARLGEWGFRWLFFAVAAVTFAALTIWYADHRGAGGPGLALGDIPVLRGPLLVAVAAGVTLMIASLAGYRGSPYEVDAPGASRTPRGLDRITRHPFMAGMALFAGAHALLAPHRSATILMLALAVLAVAGPWHQDVKLARLRGRPFADWLAATSAVPFAAIAAGRQHFVWRELPIGAIVAGAVLAVWLRRVHGDVFAHHGAWVALGIVGPAAAIMVAAWSRSRRAAGAPHEAPAAR